MGHYHDDADMAVAVHLVVVEDPLGEGLVQHLPVPLLQPLGLGDLLICRVAVEDVVVPFAGRAGPDVSLGIAAEKRVSESGPSFFFLLIWVKLIQIWKSHVLISRITC